MKAFTLEKSMYEDTMKHTNKKKHTHTSGTQDPGRTNAHEEGKALTTAAINVTLTVTQA